MWISAISSRGKNVLAFVFLGDAKDYRTGLYAAGPFVIGDYRTLLGIKSEYLDLMLIGIYFFFSLYHLILFALRPANKPFLFYGLGTLAFAFYLFSRSFIIYDLVLDTAIIRGMELASLFVFFPLFVAFFDLCNRGKISLFTWIYGSISFLFAILASLVWGEPILELWQKTIPIPVIYLFVFDCILPIIARLRPREKFAIRDRLRLFVKADGFWTILIALIIVGMCIAASFMSLNSQGAFVAAKLGAFFLIFGTATILARQFTSLFRDVEDFTAGLEAKVKERTQALSGALEAQAKLNENLQASGQRLQMATDLAAKDLRIAVQVQQGIFPQNPPDLLDWDLAFINLPIQGVSGDLYDFYVEGGRLAGAFVGGVSSQGISAGLITVLARSILYRGFHDATKLPLGRVLEEINAKVSTELSSVESRLLVSLLRFEGGQVEYANAAHTDLLFRRNGKPRANVLSPQAEGGFKGEPLGSGSSGGGYRSAKFAMASGDSLLVFTDCLVDARDEEGRPFGLDGLITAYGLAPANSAAEMLEYIIDEWKFHVGGAEVGDDLTAMLLKKK